MIYIVVGVAAVCLSDCLSFSLPVCLIGGSFVYVSVCVCVCMCLCVYVYVCVCVCVCVCVLAEVVPKAVERSQFCTLWPDYQCQTHRFRTKH